MLAVISPAKSLDFDRPLPDLDPADLAPTRPSFEEDATALARSAARMSAKTLGDLMHISPKLAALNVQRFRGFAEHPERPAIYAFAGDVYVGFEVHSLDAEAVRFAQGHLRILSGLYGLLRPLDEIRAYRLEMGTKWAPRRPNLYAYWGKRLADRLREDLAETGGQAVINLASKEYWHALEPHIADLPVIEIDFREEGPDGLRFNTFAAKRARGMMARYICEHRLDTPEALQSFDSDGYAFDPAGSDAARWRFTRT